MAETWTVNGIDLNTFAWKIEKGDGLASTPPLRDTDIEIPGRHGVLAASRLSYGAGQLVLNMWVKGVDSATGLVPGGSTDVDAYHGNADTLVRLFNAPTLTVVHTWPNGTARKAVGRLTSSIDFTREVSSPLFGRFSVAVRIHGGFWLDNANPTPQALSLTSGSAGTLTNYAAATAPMDRLAVTFGPMPNPQVTQTSTGNFLAYDGVIAGGRQLVIDQNAANPLLGTIDAGGFWTPDYSLLRFSGGSPWFELRPEPAGGPVLQLSHTGGGNGSVTVSGPRAYFTP